MSQPDVKLNGKHVALVAPFTLGLLSDEDYEQYLNDGMKLGPEKVAQAAQEYKDAKSAATR